MRSPFPVAALLLACLAATAAPAQEVWPSRPVKLIVPFAAGGNTDAVGRVAAEYFQKATGVAFTVENRGGAGGIVGTDAVARAAPDGYTLCVCSIGSITVAPSIETLPYDPLADLEPVSLLSTNALAVIVPSALPIASVDDLVRAAKAKPGSLDYGSSGVGGLMHISALLFQARTGTSLTHVPYRGGAPAVAAVLGGQVQIVFANMSDALPQIEGGTVRSLAVTTRQRDPQLPNVPTLLESGVADFHVESWNGLFAPKATPKPIIDRLAGLIDAMARDPESQKRFAQFGSQTASNGPARFREELAAETTLWRDVLRQAGLAKAR